LAEWLVCQANAQAYHADHCVVSRVGTASATAKSYALFRGKLNMQVKVIPTPKEWTGTIQLTFDNIDEAELFVSIFNTGKIATAIREVGGSAYGICSAIYNKASELGVSNSAYVGRLADALRS
jgi:hypothetical protein